MRRCERIEYVAVTQRIGDLGSLYTELRGDSNVLYALTTTHELRRLNLASATVSGPLAGNVADFAVSEERLVAYTTLPDGDGARTVGYITGGNSKAKTIATYQALGTAALRVATGSYYGEHYVAIAHGEALDILRGSLPSSDTSDKLALTKVAGLTIAGGSDYIGFAPGNNRIVYAARDAKIVTYDLELQTNATLALQSPLTRDVEWLDNYHIFATGNTSYYYD